MTAVLHLLVEPYGAGKTNFVQYILEQITHLPFINADEIARAQWSGDEERNAWSAARIASERRESILTSHRSFITETVFSHPSKVNLVRRASVLQYQVTLHVILIPLAQALRRVQERVAEGGHSVPEEKIVARYGRLWENIAEAAKIADATKFYDNSNAEGPFKLVAAYTHGAAVIAGVWSAWLPMSGLLINPQET